MHSRKLTKSFYCVECGWSVVELFTFTIKNYSKYSKNHSETIYSLAYGRLPIKKTSNNNYKIMKIT